MIPEGIFMSKQHWTHNSDELRANQTMRLDVCDTIEFEGVTENEFMMTYACISIENDLKLYTLLQN